MSVVVGPEALDDLTAAVEFLAERSPRAATELVQRAFALFRSLDAGEFDGPGIRLRDGREVQSWPLPPFRVYYQRSGPDLVVLRVYHQRRRPF